MSSLYLFSTTDLLDIAPHEDDPIVIYVIAMGRNVQRVLVDQGSSTKRHVLGDFRGFKHTIESVKAF